jgi:hypothetical protein
MSSLEPAPCLGSGEETLCELMILVRHLNSHLEAHLYVPICAACAERGKLPPIRLQNVDGKPTLVVQQTKQS